MHSLLINDNTFPKILCSHETNENMQESFDHNMANAQNAYSTVLHCKTRSEVSMMHKIREKDMREKYKRNQVTFPVLPDANSQNTRNITHNNQPGKTTILGLHGT